MRPLALSLVLLASAAACASLDGLAGGDAGLRDDGGAPVPLGDASVDVSTDRPTDSGADSTSAVPLLRFLPEGAFTLSDAKDVDLTTEGTIDWSTWGFEDNKRQRRKAIGQAFISDLVAADGGTIGTAGTTQWPARVTWTDGTNDTPTGTSRDFVYSTRGFSFSVRTTPQRRKLTLHFGVFQGAGTLKATMSGGAVPPITATIDSDAGSVAGQAAIELASPSDGTFVTIDLATTTPSGTPAIALIAVTLGD